MRAAALCSIAAAALLGTASAIHLDFLGGGAGGSSGRSRQQQLDEVASFSFPDFVRAFNRTYAPGSEEWDRRRAIYDEQRGEILTFLGGPPRAWTLGITEFMDYTGPERKAMLGYKRGLGGGAWRGGGGGRELPPSVLELDTREWSHPDSFAFAGGGVAKIVHSQGGCGSCWAHAAMSTLEGQVEAKGLRLSEGLSVDSTTHCTPNPRHCGGSGGCDGATVELAFEMIKKRGAPLRSDGHAAGGQCHEEAFEKAKVSIEDYVVLPGNKLHPLMQALYDTGGPISVSVDATHWFHYTGGIFSDTANGGEGDFTVNHAVTLMAYSMPQGENGRGGYWLIKNSWGSYWGEKGFIRLEMKEDEEAHCGMDRKTHDGLACDGDPDEAWVCGTCGILYDSAYPTGVKLL